MRSARQAVVLLAGAALLTGCAGDEPAPSDTPQPVTVTASPGSPSTTTPAEPSPTAPEPTGSEPPFPADTSPDEQAASAGALLSVTGVATGQHEGYDRVVLTFGGSGTPGWRVEYVDEAVDDPSDQRLDVAGDGTLRLILTGTGYPDDTGHEQWTGSRRTSGYAAVQEVVVRGVFEGQTLGFVGLDRADRPFRVFALNDPTRVVVDVAHTD